MKKVLIALGLVVVAIAGFMAWKMLQPIPEDLDLRTEKTSKLGYYNIAFNPKTGIPDVGPIHAWLAKITDKDGNLVRGAKVVLDGGMPQHGHGLPTTPKVTGEIEPGVYEIDGVKFSMRGWWKFNLDIDGSAGKDSAVFNVVLK